MNLKNEYFVFSASRFSTSRFSASRFSASLLFSVFIAGGAAAQSVVVAPPLSSSGASEVEVAGAGALAILIERAESGARAPDLLAAELARWAAHAGIEEQHALAVSVSDGLLTTPTRALLVRSALSLQKPTREVADAVWSYRNGAVEPGERHVATLIYGALGGVEQQSLQLSASVQQRLETALLAASVAERPMLLAALGNVGDWERSLGVAAPHFSSNNTAVRARAFHIFQKAKGDAAFAEFVARLEAEPDANVREAALRIARVMPKSAAKSAWARRQLSEAKRPETRVILVDILGADRTTPANVSALKELLDVERARTVRRAVYRYVSHSKMRGAQ